MPQRPSACFYKCVCGCLLGCVYVCVCVPDRVLDIGLVSGGRVTAAIGLLGPSSPPDSNIQLTAAGEGGRAAAAEEEEGKWEKTRERQ